MRAFVSVLFLLSFGCHNAAEPLANLSGHWAAPYSVPGSSLEFTLSQLADSLHGSGTYAIEAGSAGTLELRGAYARPAVQLTLIYQFGTRLYFTGQVAGSRMVGTVTDSAGHVSSRTFLKR